MPPPATTPPPNEMKPLNEMKECYISFSNVCLFCTIRMKQNNLGTWKAPIQPQFITFDLLSVEIRDLSLRSLLHREPVRFIELYQRPS